MERTTIFSGTAYEYINRFGGVATVSEWSGEGWYRIGWSDGGMDWTNNGPVWFGFERELEDELYIAGQYETETHLLWVEYMGDGDEPKEQ